MDKEYIERGALLKHKMPVYGAYDSSLTFEAVPVPYIKGAPTADVQKIRHGKWEKSDFDVVCSRCGYIESAPRPFCSECGTKMDKGEY